METKQKKHFLFGLCAYGVIFLFLILITNLGHVNAWTGGLLQLFRPLIIGLVIAYLCNPFFRFFERKLFFKISPFSLRRGISLIFTYLVLFLILGVLVMLIIPQLVDSILNFISNSEAYLDRTVGELNGLISTINSQFAASSDKTEVIPLLNAEDLKVKITNFVQSLNFNPQIFLDILTADTISSIIGIAGIAITVFTDTIFGLFISIYFLHTKEKRYAQVMRFRKAIFSDKTNARITKICTTADKSFGGFIRGKILDSAMVGVLVYAAISLLGVPYAILIAVIVAITDIVPIIGPFIGVIPSAIIILLTDPGKVIPFLLCILVVQQFDGNVMAPKILGENTGVSSLCVMIAITTMGGLWGLAGMVLGVPLFATVLELTSDYLEGRLAKKGLQGNSRNYYYDLGTTPDESDEGGSLFARMKKRKKMKLQKQTIGGEGDLTEVERSSINTYLCFVSDDSVQDDFDNTEPVDEELPIENEKK